MKIIVNLFLASVLMISTSIFAQTDEKCHIDVSKVLQDALDSEPSLTPSEIEDAIGRGFAGNIKLYAGSPEHKSQGWRDYEVRTARGETKDWPYERWSSNYDLNQSRWHRTSEIAEDHRATLGWGEPEVPITVPFEHGRRLDIADVENLRGVEVKSGYATLNLHHRQQIIADRYLVEREGWEISWYFDGSPTKPLLDALDDAGITYSFRAGIVDPRL